MNTQYCARVDASIKRCERGCVLYDGNGDELFLFPLFWTDDLIMKALDFANQAFSRGVEVGRVKKLYEIRGALGIEI
jgi:hypothetical protein